MSKEKKGNIAEDSHTGEISQLQHLCGCSSRNKNSYTNFNTVDKDCVIQRKG